MTRRRLTLLGPDVLLVAMGGKRPNNAVFVVECGGRLCADRIGRAVEVLLPLAPYMSSRLERPFPWGRLRWSVVAGQPAVVRRRVGPQATIDSIVDELLNQTVDPRRQAPLKWLVVDSEGGARSWLVLAWVHPLMDPRGAELLVAMLDAVDRRGDSHAWAAAQRVESPAEAQNQRADRHLARQALAHLNAIGREPPPVLNQSAGTAGLLRHCRLVVPAVTRQLPFTLALVGRAMAELWRERGFALDQPFLVPISVDRRRKGEAGPVFGNFLSFHFARFAPRAAEDVPATASIIRRDMADAVRANRVEALWVGMNFARYSPARYLLRPFRGHSPASFHCADTGEARPAFSTLFGSRVCGVYHAPSVQPRPGLGLFFSRFGDMESIVAVWVDSVVTQAEIDRLLENIRSAVAATPQSSAHAN